MSYTESSPEWREITLGVAYNLPNAIRAYQHAQRYGIEWGVKAYQKLQAESQRQLYGSEPPAAAVSTPRSSLEEKIQALIDRGATPGERAAAQAAMNRLHGIYAADNDFAEADAEREMRDAQDEADYNESLA